MKHPYSPLENLFLDRLSYMLMARGAVSDDPEFWPVWCMMDRAVKSTIKDLKDLGLEGEVMEMIAKYKQPEQYEGCNGDPDKYNERLCPNCVKRWECEEHWP